MRPLLQPGGSTTAAAQATKMLRFIRVIRALEALAAWALLHTASRALLCRLGLVAGARAGGGAPGEAHDGDDDRLAPSNVGHRLREAATLQVGRAAGPTCSALLA